MPEKIVRIARPLSWRHEFIRSHDYRCHYCNRFAGSVEVGPDGKPWHVEHMNALAAGGEDVEENLTLACERCNSLKYTLPYENFKRYARQLLWSGDPKRLDLQDLERLQLSYLKSSGGVWMHRDVTVPGSPARSEIVAVIVEDPSLDDAPVVGELDASEGRSDGRHNVDFIIQAHRLAPQLIAEIHLLHAELALLRGDTQAASDAA